METNADPLKLDYDGTTLDARLGQVGERIFEADAPASSDTAAAAPSTFIDPKQLEVPARIVHRVGFSVLATILRDCGIRLTDAEEEACGVAFAPVLAQWEYAKYAATPLGVYLAIAGPIALGKLMEYKARAAEAKRAASTESSGATPESQDAFSSAAYQGAANQPSQRTVSLHAAV